LQPCNTCRKRNFICEYALSNGHSSQAFTNADVEDPQSASASSPSDRMRSVNTTGVESPEEPPSKRYQTAVNAYAVQSLHQSYPNAPHGLPGSFAAAQMPGHNGQEAGLEVRRSRQSTASGGDEVAEVYTETRMLQDPTGRLRTYTSSACSLVLCLIQCASVPR